MVDPLGAFVVLGAIGIAHLISSHASEKAGSRNCLVLFNASWIVAFTIYFSGWIRYNRMSDYTLVVIVAAVGAANAGLWLHERMTKPVGAMLATPGNAGVGVRFGRWALLFVLFILGWAVWFGIIVRALGPTVFFSNPELLRRELSNGNLSSQVNAASAGLLLGPLVVVALMKNTSLWPLRPSLRLRAAAGAVLMPLLLVTLGRSLLMTTILWLVGTGLVATRPKSTADRQSRNRQMVALFLIGLLGFQVVAVALNKDGQSNPAISAHLSGPLVDSPYAGLAIYFSGGLPAFDRLVTGQLDTAEVQPAEGGSYVAGSRSLRPVWTLVPVVEMPSQVSPTTNVPMRFNVYTFLEPYFRDFGAAGAVIASFLLGFGLSAAQRLALRDSRFVLPAGLLVGVSALAPFADRYAEPFIAALVVVSWWIGVSSRVGLVSERVPSDEIGPFAVNSLR